MTKKLSPTGRMLASSLPLQQIPKVSTEDARRILEAFRAKHPAIAAVWNHLSQPWRGETSDGRVVAFDPGNGDAAAFIVMQREPDGAIVVTECYTGEAALRAATEWRTKLGEQE